MPSLSSFAAQPVIPKQTIMITHTCFFMINLLHQTTFMALLYYIIYINILYTIIYFEQKNILRKYFTSFLLSQYVPFPSHALSIPCAFAARNLLVHIDVHPILDQRSSFRYCFVSFKHCRCFLAYDFCYFIVTVII